MGDKGILKGISKYQAAIFPILSVVERLTDDGAVRFLSMLLIQHGDGVFCIGSIDKSGEVNQFV